MRTPHLAALPHVPRKELSSLGHFALRQMRDRHKAVPAEYGGGVAHYGIDSGFGRFMHEMDKKPGVSRADVYDAWLRRAGRGHRMESRR